MSTLKTILTDYKVIQSELRRLDTMETDAKKNIEAATDQDIELPDTQRKIMDARMVLDLAASRRKKLKDPHRESRRSLDEAFRQEIKRWNDVVVSAKAAKIAEIINANLPFWDSERECRRHFDGHEIEIIPIMDKFRRAFYEVPMYADQAKQDMARDVELFISHIQRKGKELGIS